MTSKERFRAAVEHRQVDRIPCDFSATGNMYEILRKHYQFTDYEQVREHFCADLRLAFPVYNKKKLDDYIDSDHSVGGGGTCYWFCTRRRNED